MERNMLGVLLRDSIRGTGIRRKMKLKDIVKEVAIMELLWVSDTAKYHTGGQRKTLKMIGRR